MNIVVTFAVCDFTGASRMGLHYIRALKKAGHNVSVIAQKRPTQGDSVIDYLNNEAIQVCHLGDFSAIASPTLTWKLKGYFVLNKTDLAISMNQSDVKTTSWASKLAGIKYVAFVQNRRQFHGRFPLRVLKEYDYGLSLRRCATAVIGVSEFVIQETTQRFGFPKEKTTVIPNGIDLERLTFASTRDDKFRTRWGINELDIVIMNTARIHPQKGQDVLLQALSELSSDFASVTLLLVGSCDATQESVKFYSQLDVLCHTLGLNGKVMFCGARDDVPELLSNSDIYVQASRWEGPPLPLSLLEAMAVGLPVIATDCAGIPKEFTAGKEGYYVKSNSVPDLADALLKLIKKSQEERKRMGRAARKLVVQNHDIKHGKEKFVQTVNAILGG